MIDVEVAKECPLQLVVNLYSYVPTFGVKWQRNFRLQSRLFFSGQFLFAYVKHA
jgi:hypothetical protein